MDFDPAALKARFNPEGSLIRRQQKRMTEMLVCFDRICRKHGIHYWLCSGTLLGCVRHGGYIPWDDDLDVEMLRGDYLQLLRILPKELPDNLQLQTPETDDGYFFAYAKLRDKRSHMQEINRYDRIFRMQGVYIDIFPMEPAPQWLRWISCRTLGRTYKVLNNPRYDDEEARRRVRRIWRFNQRFVFPILRAVARLCPVGEKVRYSYGIPYDDVRRRSYLFPLSRAKFEGYDMPVPHDCDPYLRDKFGDYMRLPNLDEMHPHTQELTIDDETIDNE